NEDAAQALKDIPLAKKGVVTNAHVRHNFLKEQLLLLAQAENPDLYEFVGRLYLAIDDWMPRRKDSEPQKSIPVLKVWKKRFEAHRFCDRGGPIALTDAKRDKAGEQD